METGQFTKKAEGEMPKEVENAIWGALLTGGLGAVAGGLATKPDEDLTPGEQFKQRLKNALMVGLMGAAGGGGAGYLLTKTNILNPDGKKDDDKTELTPEQLDTARGQRNMGAVGGAIVGGTLGNMLIGKGAKSLNWEGYIKPTNNWKRLGKIGVWTVPIALSGFGGYKAVDYAQDNGKPL